eukprot:TRINITY_DN49262_c0_g1_i1.p2 TRINITY_DN49262_c0_g1~~TRINITY_DN49262_c0_g1_i1.p2  ORF type:complete len:216 (-),score=56.55 TRINITY_DN49262_c0_g1_i1:91-738(-)
MSGGYGEGEAKPELLIGSLTVFDSPAMGSSFDQGGVMLASSWPAAMPARKRYEPPKAPPRKPSLVEWEVPPLELPTAPKRRSSKAADELADPLEAFTLDAEEGADENEEDEEEEGCVFDLDGGTGGGPDADEDDGFGGLQFRMAGLDDGEDSNEDFASIPKRLVADEPVSPGSEGKRDRSESMSPVLGASPTLLSALEMVAAEAGTKSRPRRGTV